MMLSSPHSDRRKRCPFCGLRFVRVGNHLLQRHGRDYTNLLAKKTPGNSHRVCPKCSRLFQRLDTHLWVSASYREIASQDLLVDGAAAGRNSCVTTADKPAMNSRNVAS